MEDWELQWVRLESTGQGSRAEPSPANGGHCLNHPDRPAGWRCSTCEAVLCDECAPERTFTGEAVRFCAACGTVCTEVEPSTPQSSRPSTPRVTPPEPRPEPPPVDQQLIPILTFPFRKLGFAALLFWWVFNFLAWPIGLVLFVPYLWRLFAHVEQRRSAVPAPWSLGGGLLSLVGKWLRLFLVPGLPLMLVYALLTSRGPLALRVAGGLSAAVVTWCLPLMVVVLFRTGSPFASFDVSILVSLMRRSLPRYLGLLRALVLAAVAGLVVSLGVSWVSLPQDLPGTQMAPRPGPWVFLGAVCASLWMAVAMGKYGEWLSWLLRDEE